MSKCLKTDDQEKWHSQFLGQRKLLTGPTEAPAPAGAAGNSRCGRVCPRATKNLSVALMVLAPVTSPNSILTGVTDIPCDSVHGQRRPSQTPADAYT